MHVQNSICVIDGSFTYHASKSLNGHRLDHVKLLDYLRMDSAARKLDMIQPHFFMAVPQAQTDEGRRFFRYLQNAEPIGPHYMIHQYQTKEMSRRCPKCGADFIADTESGVDCGIVLFLIKTAMAGRVKHIYLCAGDSDFAETVEYINTTYGVTTTVLGVSGSIASVLQSKAEAVIHLDTIVSKVATPWTKQVTRSEQPATSHHTDSAFASDEVLTARVSTGNRRDSHRR